MVKPFVEHGVKVAAALTKGARRPQTLPTQVREMASGIVTGALYPWGFFDAGPGGHVREHADPNDQQTPVLLVHGYMANKSNWFFVERELRRVGFRNIHAMNYSPRHADVDELAKGCVLRAHEVMVATGSDRIHLIGHSLGGLIIRKAVQRYGLVEAASVVTIATPHGGVDLARLSPVTGNRNMIGVQLRPGSAFLRTMWAESTPMPQTRYVAYYSNLDLLVPGRRAMMLESALDATNILMKDHGHLSIMLAPALVQSVANELGAIEGFPGFGQPLSGLPATRTAHATSIGAAERRRRA